MTSARLHRALSAATLGGLAGFLLLASLGALAYPGGTYCEPNADRYRFWGNFFCDVTSELSRRGEDNTRGAMFTHAAFACFAFALGPFWWLVGALTSRRLGVVVRVLGLPSACALVAVAWLPSTGSPRLHALMVLAAAVPGLFAALSGATGLVLGPRRSLGGLGVVTLLAGGSNTAGYVWAIVHSVACLPWLPVVQKLAGMALIAWMAAVATVFLRPEPP